MLRGLHIRRAEQSREDSLLDQQTALSMLLVDFEQAFVIHNIYRESERDLLKMSMRILAFPLIIAGAIISAKLVSSPTQLGSILRLPIIWLALVASGLINSIIVRAYSVTDRVQTEAKHQVNRLRALYLHALANQFPKGWQPVWGATNPYLETRMKFKAATFSPLVFSGVNSAYVVYGIDRILLYQAKATWHGELASILGGIYFLLQLEICWNTLRTLNKKFRRRSVDA